MTAYSVYLVDYQTHKTERIGGLSDRWNGERIHNAGDMLLLAQRLFPHSAMDSHIFILRESVSWNAPSRSEAASPVPAAPD